jgi:hypothetical protein
MSLKTLVAAACRFGPIRGLGRFGYRALANGLCLILRARSDIRAAYLVGSMASNDMEPGLSDIDLVLIIADLPCRREYDLARWIESVMRYLMPPWNSCKIGKHVYIYALREWKLVGDLLIGKRRGGPRRMFEKDDLTPFWKLDCSVKALHHFYKAYWRLQGLSGAPWHPDRGALENRLYLRALGRAVLSIDSGMEEIDGTRTPCASPDSHVSEIKKMLETADPRIDSKFVIGILPMVLQALDGALIRYTREPDNPVEFIKAANAPQIGFDAQLPSSVLDCLVSKGENRDIYVSTGRSGRIVVIDSAAREIAGELAMCLAHAEERPSTILTTTMLERLYLNAPMDDTLFVRHPCATSFVARGQYTPERVLIDAYSVFVQLRMVVNKEHTGLHVKVRDNVNQLIAYCRGHSRNSRVSGNARPPVSDRAREQGGAYVEFEELFVLGNDLVNELRHRLERGRDMPASVY